jgi:hypothetical protein
MVMSAEDKLAAHKRSAHTWYLKNRARISARRKALRAADPVLRAVLDAKATAFRKAHPAVVNETAENPLALDTGRDRRLPRRGNSSCGAATFL